MRQLHSLVTSKHKLHFNKSDLDFKQIRTNVTIGHSLHLYLEVICLPILRKFVADVLESFASTDFKLFTINEFSDTYISIMSSVASMLITSHVQSNIGKLVSSCENNTRNIQYRNLVSNKDIKDDIFTIFHKIIIIEISEMRFGIAFELLMSLFYEYSRRKLISRFIGPKSVQDVLIILLDVNSAHARRTRGDHFQFESKHDGISHSAIDELDNCWWYYVHWAYLTNFIFILTCDYEKVKKETQDILRLDKSKHNIWSRMQGHGIFYVLLKTTWSPMFDKNIQSVLGFVALINNVTKRNVVNGWIRVCPVLFLHYLRIQSLKMQSKPIFSAVQQMAEHIETCLVDRGTHETRIGTFVINTALSVMNMNLRQYRRVYLKRFAVWKMPSDVIRNIDVDTFMGFIKLCF